MAERKPITSRDIAILKRELKDLKQSYGSLRSMIGYDQLKVWVPGKRIEIQYGWLYAWLEPLRRYLDSRSYLGITPTVRNEIINIVVAIISQLVVNGKYGIKIPLEPKEIDDEIYFEKQNKYFNLDYDPCDICGENRITHQCHIIPKSEGGPYHRDNYVTLCPLHHHLFDNHRLFKSEWKILKNKIERKMSSAVIYSQEVHEKHLEFFWNNYSDTKTLDPN